MSLPVPSSRSSPAAASLAYAAAARSHSESAAQTPLSLDALLELARKHVAFWIEALPEPWPGCVLVLSVADGDELATVFHIKAHTFQSAWREASIRVRQWAWARRVDTAMLRIDWAEEVVPYPAGHHFNGRSIAQLRHTNSALADLGCEQTVLLQQALLDSSAELPAWAGPILAGHASPEPFVVLHMRGIFLSPHKSALTQLPRVALAPRQRTTHPPGADTGLLHAQQIALQSLLGQQLPGGSWPQTASLGEHLHIQYGLLLLWRTQQQEPLADAATTTALLQALARASEHAAREIAHHTPLEPAWALLVQSLCLAAALQAAQPLPAWHAVLEDLAKRTAQSLEQTRPAAATLTITRPQSHALSLLQWLAMQSYAQCCSSFSHDVAQTQHPVALQWPRDSEWPLAWLPQLPFQFASAAPNNPPWLGPLMTETCQQPALQSMASHQRLLLRQHTRAQLEALQQRLIWPEIALYLRQRQAPRPLFMPEQPLSHSASAQPVTDQPVIAQQIQWLNQACACLALLQCLKPSAALDSPAAATDRDNDSDSDPAPQHQHVPMSWSGQCLAQLTAGQWRLPQGVAPPTSVTGLAVTRQHQWQDAAVLVRPHGDSLGVPAAVTPSLRPSALIQVSGSSPLHTDLPVLQIPDLTAALHQLASSARQRVQATIIGVTGCVGKTSTLRMLAQCLLGHSSSQHEAIVQQDPVVQMINWSDTAPWALVELPLESAAQHLPMLAPDVLVVTNLGPLATGADAAADAAQHHHALLSLLGQMRAGSVLVFNNALAAPEPLQSVASEGQVRLCSFGPHPTASLHAQAYEDSGLLQVQVQAAAITEQLSRAEVLQIQLQPNGLHMALNAQAALTVLHALQLPLAISAAPLSHWRPLPGAGQTVPLPQQRLLLDHSNTSELLATQAAFKQLQTHTPEASQRVIVFGGIKPGVAAADHLPLAQMQLEPLIRNTAARRVLLYGQAMQGLAEQLQDLRHVSWYEDLNQLIQSLLRALRPHDSLLLVGKAIVNLSIVADAVQEEWG